MVGGLIEEYLTSNKGIFKIFPLPGKKIAISYISQDRELDQGGRIKLRSDILLLSEYQFKIINNNFFSLEGYFKNTSNSNSQIYHEDLFLHELLSRREQIKIDDLAEIIKKRFDNKTVINTVGLLLSGQKIILNFENELNSKLLIEYIYRILPSNIAFSLSTVTYAWDPMTQEGMSIIVCPKINLDEEPLIKKENICIVREGMSYTIDSKIIKLAELLNYFMFESNPSYYNIHRAIVSNIIKKKNISVISKLKKLKDLISPEVILFLNEVTTKLDASPIDVIKIISKSKNMKMLYDNKNQIQKEIKKSPKLFSWKKYLLSERNTFSNKINTIVLNHINNRDDRLIETLGNIIEMYPYFNYLLKFSKAQNSHVLISYLSQQKSINMIITSENTIKHELKRLKNIQRGEIT